MNILLLMMGGQGTRFGADIPKQYIEINGHPIFSYIVKKYSQMNEINHCILVSHKDWIPFVKNEMESLQLPVAWTVVEGGCNRSESVLHGLQTADIIGVGGDIVLIHDATHPYVDREGTKKIIESAAQYGGATLGGAEYDTMYQITSQGFLEKVIPRQLIYSGASPEAFRLNEILNIYSTATKKELEVMTSAGAIALAHQIQMKVIPAQYLNLKITHKKDMDLFLLLAENYFFKE